jgi:hypothetical protein
MVTDKVIMKIKPVNSPEVARRLKEVNYAGSEAAKAKIVLDEAEKMAKETNAQLVKPSKFMQTFSNTLKKLNVI